MADDRQRDLDTKTKLAVRDVFIGLSLWGKKSRHRYSEESPAARQVIQPSVFPQQRHRKVGGAEFFADKVREAATADAHHTRKFMPIKIATPVFPAIHTFDFDP